MTYSIWASFLADPSPPPHIGPAAPPRYATSPVSERDEAARLPLDPDLLASLGVAVFRTDAGGRWTYLSPAWARLSGYTVGESLGMPSRLYLHRSDVRRCAKLIRAMQRNPGVLCRETLRVRRADGEYGVVEATARLEGGLHGEPVSACGYLIERGAAPPARTRLATGNALAARSARLSAQASLTLITDALQTLTGTALSQPQAHAVQLARSAAHALRVLIDAPLPAAARATPVRPLRILLADDQPVTQKLVTLLLEKWGHRVEVAGDGRDAVDRFMQEPFDLVLMDLQMPVMDGLTATQTLREHEARRQLARTPVIAMTAQNSATDRELCLRAGMDDFLPKPVTAVALEQMLLKHQPARQASTRANEK